MKHRQYIKYVGLDARFHGDKTQPTALRMRGTLPINIRLEHAGSLIPCTDYIIGTRIFRHTDLASTLGV